MAPSMAWLFLLAAGLAEVVGTILLKYSQGFSRPLPTVFCLVFMIGSLGLLGLGTRHVPISVAYIFWTGFGAFGAVVGGAVLFGEPLTAARIGCIMLVVGGVIGLYMTGDV
jgi:quaternary ammonium compound-resistance protein SugE